nr:NAD(P)H-dependent oxidoreductase [Acinetobacter sp. Marseille-Q1620]
MVNILRIDSSVRTGISGRDEHGSLTRRLTELFIQNWKKHQPDSEIKIRDVGQFPPKFIDQDWIVSEFGNPPPEFKQQRMQQSDEMIDELHWADIIVIGVPMYNFGPPAHLKAYIDNIVRINKTYRFNKSLENPYIGLLDKNKQVVLLSSRGGHGFDQPDPFFTNHVEPSVKTAFNFIGLTQFHDIAIEYQEEGGEELKNSIENAEQDVVTLVKQLTLVKILPK